MDLTHRIFDRVIFHGLLLTIVITAIPYGSVQPWWIALFECAIFVLAMVAVVDLIITKERLPAGASVALPLLALCLFLLFQSLPLFASGNAVIPDLRLAISADPHTTQLLAIKLLAFVLAGVLLLRYVNTEERVRTLVYLVIGIGVASAVFGILRRGSGGPSWFFPLPNAEQGFAQFVNRNHFGFLMEITFGLALGLAVRGVRGYQRILLLPIAAVLWISLVVANSRGAMFASLCQVLFLGVVVDPTKYLTSDTEASARQRLQIVGRWAARVVLAVILIVVFVAGVRWVGGERVATNIELASTAYDQPPEVDPRQNTRRKQIWLASWNMFKAHPLVGSGLGAYWIAITKYHDASGQFTPQEAHNDYLELLASGGLVGAALIVCFVIRLANHSLRIPRRGVMSGATLGALVGICGVLIHSFVDFGLHITANALVFTALVTLLVKNVPGKSSLVRT